MNDNVNAISSSGAENLKNFKIGNLQFKKFILKIDTLKKFNSRSDTLKKTKFIIWHVKETSIQNLTRWKIFKS